MHLSVLLCKKRNENNPTNVKSYLAQAAAAMAPKRGVDAERLQALAAKFAAGAEKSLLPPESDTKFTCQYPLFRLLHAL